MVDVKKPGPDGMVTYNTTAWIGSPGDTNGRVDIKFGTFLCPHCDKTHVVMFMCDGDGKPTLELTWKMDAENSEFMAEQFINPNPIDARLVLDVRTRRDNNNDGDYLRNPPKDNLDG